MKAKEIEKLIRRYVPAKTFLGSNREKFKAELQELHQIGIQRQVKNNVDLGDVSVSVADTRQAFSDYYISEGCSCCQNEKEHNKAENKLAELLTPDKYDDDSGFDWYKYATQR